MGEKEKQTSPSPQEKVEVDGERCENCGQPFAYVWWCHDPDLWETVTGNERQPGSLEHAPGLWCIPCFDSACLEKGVGWVEWAPLNIRHLSLKGPGGPEVGGGSGLTDEMVTAGATALGTWLGAKEQDLMHAARLVLRAALKDPRS